jgi:hypothetical protein
MTDTVSDSEHLSDEVFSPITRLKTSATGPPRAAWVNFVVRMNYDMKQRDFRCFGGDLGGAQIPIKPKQRLENSR